MGGGAEGQASMANWLRGGFEMDRKGQWRLKPQVADTLQRDVQAVMAQTGWQRSIARSAQDQNSFAVSVQGSVAGSIESGSGKRGNSSSHASGKSGGSLAISSVESGTTSEIVNADLNVVNYDVRQALADAERAASRSTSPHQTFSSALSEQILGPNGLRNRYLRDADNGRGTLDINAPATTLEQSSLLSKGRLSTDPAGGPSDGDMSFKSRD